MARSNGNEHSKRRGAVSSAANRNVQNLADLPATARPANQDAASGGFPIIPALAPHRGRRERGKRMALDPKRQQVESPGAGRRRRSGENLRTAGEGGHAARSVGRGVWQGKKGVSVSGRRDTSCVAESRCSSGSREGVDRERWSCAACSVDPLAAGLVRSITGSRLRYLGDKAKKQPRQVWPLLHLLLPDGPPSSLSAHRSRSRSLSTRFISSRFVPSPPSTSSPRPSSSSFLPSRPSSFLSRRSPPRSRSC